MLINFRHSLPALATLAGAGMAVAATFPTLSGTGTTTMRLTRGPGPS
jgi:hypothetical protein